jgi:hypothetical protein
MQGQARQSSTDASLSEDGVLSAPVQAHGVGHRPLSLRTAIALDHAPGRIPVFDAEDFLG